MGFLLWCESRLAWPWPRQVQAHWATAALTCYMFGRLCALFWRFLQEGSCAPVLVALSASADPALLVIQGGG